MSPVVGRGAARSVHALLARQTLLRFVRLELAVRDDAQDLEHLVFRVAVLFALLDRSEGRADVIESTVARDVTTVCKYNSTHNFRRQIL